MSFSQPFEPCPEQKIMLNIGALFDISTGTYVAGKYGEYILNGGLSPLTGIVGGGNLFKSTIMHYQSFTALSRFNGSIGSTFDTEVNVQEWHLVELTSKIPELNGEDIITSGRWVVTDKTKYSGNKWYEVFKQFIEDKVKNSKKYTVETPFLNRTGDKLFTMLIPTFTEIDSFTEFETDDVSKMQDANELGESGGNTIHMRQGLAKMRLLMEAPRLNGGSYNYLLMTAHIGKEAVMQSGGGGREVPIVKLKHLKNGDKIKGTTDKFTFVTQNCWHCFDASPLMQADGDGPLYPRDSNDRLKYDTDLNIVKLRNLRSKSGISGMTIMLVVSQSEGVLPTLSEFHYIKEMERYGLEGNIQNYSLAIYPEVKLSRTTVRSKIDNDPLLRRAINITSEMCQMHNTWHNLDDDLLCTPKQLYDDLKALGYDWNNDLLCSRGWWTTNNDSPEHSMPFLSTMDLLRMRKGLYHPYWMNADKTRKKEYIKS
jgi:hypothetical protein